MSQQAPSLPQQELHGVFLGGNPISRPFPSASKCENFRVMPGFWLRLFGGRKGRYNLAKMVQQIHQYRLLGYPGADTCLLQYRFGTNDSRWTWFSLLTYVPDPFDVEAISGAYDGNWSYTHPAAVCNLPDRVVYYNGLGVRDGSGSRPPFSSMLNGLRFFGLDCYCPSGNPTVSFTEGAGLNAVTTTNGIKVWVGVYNSATDHYSNAVYCGTVGKQTVSGTITVSNLNRIKIGTHGSAETAEQKLVFYATIDGGAVPYLILNSALNGPFTVAAGSTSADLSLAADTTNGWVLDLAHEAPSQNFPPRPMRSICYANGRLYGVQLGGGSGSAVYQLRPGTDFSALDFTYQSESRDLAGVWWSASATDALGDPLQSWPLVNFAPTPNGDQPNMVEPGDIERSVLVFTPRAVYRLTEALDGIHVYDPVSEIHGLFSPTTFRRTRYGLVWVDQYNQIVMLPPTGPIQILSDNYQPLMSAPAVCADYLLDSVNDVDCYRVYLSDGTCVCHDFKVGGEAYTATGQAYSAARTVTDGSGKRHHLVADTAIYTQEGQPEDDQILVKDETFTTGQTKTTSIRTATYVGNWTDQDEADRRKELQVVEYIGDPNTSCAFWKDFEPITQANATGGYQAKAAQSHSDSRFEFRLPSPAAFWHKVKLVLTPKGLIPTKHVAPELQGDQVQNFFGSIMRLLYTYEHTENRD
jgi:hypothetical protein